MADFQALYDAIEASSKLAHLMKSPTLVNSVFKGIQPQGDSCMSCPSASQRDGAMMVIKIFNDAAQANSKLEASMEKLKEKQSEQALT